MKQFIKLTISTKVNLLILIAVLLVSSSSLFLSVRSLKQEGQAAIDNYSRAVMGERQSQIKDLVNSVYTTAEEYLKASRNKSRIRQEYGDQVKVAVNQAIGVFHSIHNSKLYKNAKKHRKCAKEIINTMRWGLDGTGYFWIQDIHGKMVHHPFKPALNGKDIFGFKDPDGKLLFKEMDDVVKRDGSGFVNYKWPKPGSDVPVDKISYVKLFKPWGWIIGGGVYLESTAEDLKKRALETIGAIRYGDDNQGFFLIYDSSGNCILDPSRPENQNKNHYNLKDKKGNYFVRRIIKTAASTRSNGYYTCHMEKPGSGKILPQLAYARKLQEWDWNITTGVFTDDLDQMIARQTEIINNGISEAIMHMLTVTMGISIILLVISHIAINKRVVGPIKNIVTMLRDIAEGEGDLTKRIKTYSGDEIQELAEWFNRFIDNIHGLISKIKNESAEAIGESITEFSSTASQLAASASETSTTISQVTVTTEQVRQTAHTSNDKANQVRKLASEMQDSAQKGHDCTIDTINGMQSIKKEMQSVADSIEKLSEQTMSIGEIISTVNDLSDQSNLLSVNAAIEAAKAGEYGKGFAVVAQKIMSLANQSKDATAQVKNILIDIQKATGAAVEATKKSSKAVETGEQLSKSAGDAINILTDQVTASGEAAVRIASGNQQQLEGMDQLASAMENIKETAIQNSDGAAQLKTATANLKQLAKELRNLTDKFQL